MYSQSVDMSFNLDRLLSFDVLDYAHISKWLLRLSVNQDKIKTKQCEHRVCVYCHSLGVACLTCCIQRPFVYMMTTLLHQAQCLNQVVCRSHSRTRVTTRLFQQVKSITNIHHVPANSFQTPGEEENIGVGFLAFVKNLSYNCWAPESLECLTTLRNCPSTRT